MEPRLKSKSSPNNTKFCHTNNNNDNSKLDWYWYDSLDSLYNKCFDFNEKKEEKEKWKSDRKKPIILALLLSLRLTKLSWNKMGKVELYRVWGKRLFVIKKRKMQNARKYQY